MATKEMKAKKLLEQRKQFAFEITQDKLEVDAPPPLPWEQAMDEPDYQMKHFDGEWGLIFDDPIRLQQFAKASYLQYLFFCLFVFWKY